MGFLNLGTFQPDTLLGTVQSIETLFEDDGANVVDGVAIHHRQDVVGDEQIYANANMVDKGDTLLGTLQSIETLFEDDGTNVVDGVAIHHSDDIFDGGELCLSSGIGFTLDPPEEIVVVPEFDGSPLAGVAPPPKIVVVPPFFLLGTPGPGVRTRAELDYTRPKH